MDRLWQVQASCQDLLGVVGQNRGFHNRMYHPGIKLRTAELE